MHKVSERITLGPPSVVPHKFSPAPKIRAAAPGWIAGSKRVFIQEGERCWIIRVADIVLLESEGNSTRVHFGLSTPMVARSLNYMEKRLDPTIFFRANRQTIINLLFVECIEPYGNGGFLFRLQSGPEIVVSRRLARLLKAKMTL
jgi:two-component system, LytTR family, response regulator